MSGEERAEHRHRSPPWGVEQTGTLSVDSPASARAPCTGPTVVPPVATCSGDREGQADQQGRVVETVDGGDDDETPGPDKDHTEHDRECTQQRE